MFDKNYHTHTKRCNHADGEDRDYVVKAIDQGYKVLGFSDHSPYVFKDKSYYSGFRMTASGFGNYVDSIASLKEEFKDRIEVLTGLEAEYYPDCFQDFLDLVHTKGVDYLILGQHFLGNEYDTHLPSSAFTDDVKVLDQYVSQVIEGIQTKKFSYIAHPDIIYYGEDDDNYTYHMNRLIKSAFDLGIPLEINLLGMRGPRFYPHDYFWKLVADCGCKTILGVDAHSPYMLDVSDILPKAMALVEKYHLNLVDSLDLHRP